MKRIPFLRLNRFLRPGLSTTQPSFQKTMMNNTSCSSWIWICYSSWIFIVKDTWHAVDVPGSLIKYGFLEELSSKYIIYIIQNFNFLESDTNLSKNKPTLDHVLKNSWRSWKQFLCIRAHNACIHDDTVEDHSIL